MRVDFKARLLVDLQSGDFGRILAALEKIVVRHNIPDFDDPGKRAETLGDADLDGLNALMEAFGEARKSLPPR